MDGFEWKAGFTEKFGLYHVDFNHPNRTRTPKLSAKVYKKIIETNQINYSYLPEIVQHGSEPSLAHNAQKSLIALLINIFIVTLSRKF